MLGPHVEITRWLLAISARFRHGRVRLFFDEQSQFSLCFLHLLKYESQIGRQAGTLACVMRSARPGLFFGPSPTSSSDCRIAFGWLAAAVGRGCEGCRLLRTGAIGLLGQCVNSSHHGLRRRPTLPRWGELVARALKVATVAVASELDVYAVGRGPVSRPLTTE
jgi:hypothetical protein